VHNTDDNKVVSGSVDRATARFEGQVTEMIEEARNGNPILQFAIGAAVLDRNSDAVGREEALRLLTSAAESGFSPAMLYLAAMEEFTPRTGAAADTKLANWLSRAVEHGHIPAHRLLNENLLAWTCESDLQAGVRWAEGLQARIVELEGELSKTNADLTKCRRQSEERLTWHTQSRLHCEYLEGLLRKVGIPFINRYGHGGAKGLTVEATGAGTRQAADGVTMNQGI
jgi:hypothetical protein